MLHRVGRPLRCQGCRRRVGTASSPLPYRDKRRHSSSAAAAAAAAQRPARPHTALLLVDFQRGFITGEWAEEQGGAEQVLPIATAAARLADLYASEKLAAVPALATRFYLQSPDALPPPNLDAAFSSIPWTSKPGSNVTESEEFAPWLEDRLAEGVTTLVVCGCTTTSCVRVSSLAVQRAFGDRGLRVVVDLSLCGARTANYARDGSAALDPQLMREYTQAELEGRSVVDLALLQMRKAGVLVVESYDWEED